MTPDPRHERAVLAVDLGTSGLKVGVVTLTGQLLWHDHADLPTRLLPGGGAVQDAVAWWDLVRERARRAVGQVRAEQVAAVAVTGQWASTVPVDATGEPVGDAILWMDTRGRHLVRERIGGPVAGYRPRPLATWIRRTGGIPSPNGGDPVSHMLLLRHELADVAQAARWYLEPVDYLTMRFTGVAAATHASMTGAWLTDNRRLAHLDYDRELVELAGVDPAKLPPLRSPGSVVGPVAAAVAGELGLPPGVPVVTGAPDLHATTCGSGAIGPFEAHLSISTTSWIGAPVPFKKTDVRHSIASIPGLRPGTYLIANNHETAGRCYEWVRGVLGAEGYDALDTIAAAAPPGAGGAVFTPWLKGERSPVDDRHARGGFHNLSLTTTQADLVRAVLEGVALNDQWLHGYVERFAGRRLDPLRIVGGGAVSDLWCQIHADVMQRTVERVHEPLHAGLSGAALLAGLALGEVDAAEVRRLVHVERTFTPDPATRDVYGPMVEELPRLHKAQKGLSARLAGARRGAR